MKNVLQFAGRNGALVVISGVVLGFGIPALSDLARPYLALAIFIFTFGSFLKFDPDSVRVEIAHATRTLLMLLWATFGVPLVVFSFISLIRPSHDLAQGLIFWALVPTSPACVPFAAILGLNTTIALLATVIATAATPFYLPALAAAMGGYQLTFDPFNMCLRLVIIVGGAFLAAIVVKRFAARFVRENPEAMTGIAVLALFLAGLGSMRGMQTYFVSQPRLVLELVLVAFSLLLAFQFIGTILFWRSGRTPALTAGLISGTRTITLAWVVLGPDVSPLADMFLASAMVAKYAAPALTKWLITRLNGVELSANSVTAPEAKGLL
jgi:predicted Na+-dependent transporter